MKTFINPEHLWKYREFDRSLTPAPSCFGIVQYSVAEIKEWIKTNAMQPIEFVIIDNEFGLIIDGNHRVAACIMNGTKMIPIEVINLTYAQAERAFTHHVLARFVPM